MTTKTVSVTEIAAWVSTFEEKPVAGYGSATLGTNRVGWGSWTDFHGRHHQTYHSNLKGHERAYNEDGEYLEWENVTGYVGYTQHNVDKVALAMDYDTKTGAFRFLWGRAGSALPNTNRAYGRLKHATRVKHDTPKCRLLLTTGTGDDAENTVYDTVDLTHSLTQNPYNEEYTGTFPAELLTDLNANSWSAFTVGLDFLDGKGAPERFGEDEGLLTELTLLSGYKCYLDFDAVLWVRDGGKQKAERGGKTVELATLHIGTSGGQIDVAAELDDLKFTDESAMVKLGNGYADPMQVVYLTGTDDSIDVRFPNNDSVSYKIGLEEAKDALEEALSA